MSRLRTQKANEETFKPGVMVVLPQQLGLDDLNLLDDLFLLGPHFKVKTSRPDTLDSSAGVQPIVYGSC